MKKLVCILLAVFLLAGLCIPAAGCSDKPEEQDPPAETVKVDINNGFEGENALALIDGKTGVQTSINEDARYVNNGSKSLKMEISLSPVPKFAFSEQTLQLDISDYDYLSFWIYVDHDEPISLSNTANEGVYSGNTVVSRNYRNAASAPRTWTKIRLEKGNAFFDNMMYYLPYGEFILCGTGSEFNNILNYTVYLDDVSVYREGMDGEAELAVVDASRNDAGMQMPNGIVGQAYTLPKVRVSGPDGNEIIGAKVDIEVFDPLGNAVTLTDNSFTTERAGTYTLSAAYTYGGRRTLLREEFEMRFVDFENLELPQPIVGERYEILSPQLYVPDTHELLAGAELDIAVTDSAGNAVSAEGKAFTPSAAQRYTIRYTATAVFGGVENTAVQEKTVWATELGGLVSDFTNADDAQLLATTEQSPGVLMSLSGAVAKPSFKSDSRSMLLEIISELYPTFRFGESFPYGNLEKAGLDYLSFWVYNESETDVYLISSGCELKRYLLPANLWTRVVFEADDFASSFDWRENVFTVYDASESPQRLIVNLYIDDIRVYKEGYGQELDFSSAITTTDWDEVAQTGKRFAVNGTYELDRNMYVFGSDEQLPELTAEVESVTGPTGAALAVDGGTFTPVREGRHVVTLTCEHDGILNSATKLFTVRPQLEFEPDTDPLDAVMPYGTAGEVYDASDYTPALWNKGEPADISELNYVMTATDPDGNEVDAADMKFTPSKKGIYELMFYAQDAATREFASYTLRIGVFAQGKTGILADFEDDDCSMLKSTNYYYGVVNPVRVTDKAVGGNEGKKALIEVTTDTDHGLMAREPQFYLDASNMLQNISLTKSFSFDIYIEDADARSFLLQKARYYNWSNTPFGTCRRTIPSNQWVTVTFQRENYDTELGGYIFAGSDQSLGGVMWTADDDRFISNFYIVDSAGLSECGGINIYLDNIRVEV